MTAHGEALRTESNDDPLVEGIKQDYTKLDLAAAERAIPDWYDRLRERRGYTEALEKWFNPNYLSLMKEKVSKFASGLRRWSLNGFRHSVATR